RPRLPRGQRAEGVPARRVDLRRSPARRAGGGIAAARADLHSDHEGAARHPRRVRHLRAGGRAGGRRGRRGAAAAHPGDLPAGRGDRGRARHHRRRHQARVRLVGGRSAHPRRRAAHLRLLPVLARRGLAAGRPAVRLRQAVPARLGAQHRVGQDRARARGAAGDRGDHAQPVHRGLRTHHRGEVVATASSQEGSRVMQVADVFQEAHGRAPEGVWRAPGRVNLIGEHTDYNDGFVLPFALPWGVSVAAARRADRTVTIRSLQAPGEAHTLDDLDRAEGWVRYAAGVVWALRDAGHEVGGADIVLDGDVPRGAGLSSSAALEVAVAVALDDLYGLGLDRMELAKLARRAENEFVGMPCGIMDQAASALCTERHALYLDCRSLAYRNVPLDVAKAGMRFLIIDTGVHHELADGQYAQRRRECENAAKRLGVAALRDVTDLNAALARLDGA